MASDGGDDPTGITQTDLYKKGKGLHDAITGTIDAIRNLGPLNRSMKQSPVWRGMGGQRKKSRRRG